MTIWPTSAKAAKTMTRRRDSPNRVDQPRHRRGAGQGCWSCVRDVGRRAHSYRKCRKGHYKGLHAGDGNADTVHQPHEQPSRNGRKDDDGRPLRHKVCSDYRRKRENGAVRYRRCLRRRRSRRKPDRPLAGRLQEAASTVSKRLSDPVKLGTKIALRMNTNIKAGKTPALRRKAKWGIAPTTSGHDARS